MFESFILLDVIISCFKFFDDILLFFINLDRNKIVQFALINYIAIDIKLKGKLLKDSSVSRKIESIFDWQYA